MASLVFTHRNEKTQELLYMLMEEKKKTTGTALVVFGIIMSDL